jgi:hypothetical protein
VTGTVAAFRVGLGKIPYRRSAGPEMSSIRYDPSRRLNTLLGSQIGLITPAKGGKLAL